MVVFLSPEVAACLQLSTGSAFRLHPPWYVSKHCMVNDILHRQEIPLSSQPYRALVGIMYAEPLPQLSRVIGKPRVFPASPQLVSPAITPSTQHTSRGQSGTQMTIVRNINLLVDHSVAICGVIMRCFITSLDAKPKANVFPQETMPIPIRDASDIAGLLLVHESSGMCFISVPRGVLSDIWFVCSQVQLMFDRRATLLHGQGLCCAFSFLTVGTKLSVKGYRFMEFMYDMTCSQACTFIPELFGNTGRIHVTAIYSCACSDCLYASGAHTNCELTCVSRIVCDRADRWGVQ